MSIKTRISCVAISMLLLSHISYAATKADDARPLGCRDVGYQFELKTLHLIPQTQSEARNQALYFIFNSLTKPVTLFQMRKDDSTRGIYLNHQIHPRQWAVLSTNEKQLNYICTIEDGKSKYGKIVDCGDSLKVCEYVYVKYGLNNKGSFWLMDNTGGGAVQEVLHYGIIPR